MRTAAFLAVSAVLGFATPAVAADASSTSVQATPASVATDTPVTLSSLVSCPADPSGGAGLTYFDGPEIVATVPVAPDGGASLTTSFSTVGTHTITATYNGNDDCDASNDGLMVQVSQNDSPPPSGGGPTLISVRDVIHKENYHQNINVNNSRNTSVDNAVNHS